MVSVKEKIKKEINDLIEEARAIEKEEMEDYDNKKGKKQNACPTTLFKYQMWYSKALTLIKQVMPERLDEFITLYENILLRLLAQKAQKIICVSRFIKNTLFKNVLTKCVIIHPGVNVSLFKPSIKKIRKTKQILFICRYAKMAEMKGLNDLIQAMKMIRGIKLKIIGEKGKIRSSRIKYLGVKTGQDLVKEIQSSNVLVLCPRAHAESFGMVLIEAMACKIPVIGTNIGGIPEVIQHGVDGMIVPSNHPGKLAGAINKILSDDQQANKMVETAYRKVHHYFTWNHQARATIKLFNSLI